MTKGPLQNIVMEICHHVKKAANFNVQKIMKDMFYYKYDKK